MGYPMETCLFFQLLPVVFYTQSYIIHNTNKKDESLCKWNEEYPVQEIELVFNFYCASNNFIEKYRVKQEI